MHTFFHTPAADRRPVHAEPAPPCLMQLTVSTASITALRQLVMRVCGEALRFMRIEACDHGARMKVWLSLSQPAVRLVMDAVMRGLPEAEFGRLSGGAVKPALKSAAKTTLQ